MARIQPKCATLWPWLKSNLGKHALAPLTGTDARSLEAAVMIIEAWYGDRHPALIEAFGIMVLRMQPSTRELAYHAIAHPGNWDDRDKLWRGAGLPAIQNPRCCSFEPGGLHLDLTKPLPKTTTTTS